MIDFERGAKTTGSKFYFNTGKTALIEWNLINKMIEFHTKNGYELVFPPHLVKKEIGVYAGQLPKFEGDYYLTTDNLMLIPTAETAMVGYHANEIIEVPKKYVAVSPCFRRECGSYGVRDKGLRRVHQFNKVELFRIEKQGIQDEILDLMITEVTTLLKELGVNNIRTMELNEKDRSGGALRTIDVEIQLPSTGEWLEVSSISWTGENQSKPALIRYREGNKNLKCHLFNGSGVALPRLMLVLLELQTNDNF
jgi:seryl-tRNA synthetase